ncbi:MAG TPA: nucleoside-diphosphate kinase [Verrucomicrobiae bacterium]|nr:nucleoside-diphosphate kinase [Verrucomicrobiae bacterium]
MERTFIMIKPDGVQRNLVGQVVTRFEQKGYKLVGMKLMQITRELAERHYAEHVGKPFFEGTVSYITSSPVVAMVWEGKNVVAGAREMMGATNPNNAAAGTIRGTYGLDISRNVIHGSDSLASAEREINLYFAKEELAEYSKDADRWLSE